MIVMTVLVSLVFLSFVLLQKVLFLMFSWE